MDGFTAANVDVHLKGEPGTDTLIIGFASQGLAGLTAVDYLVDGLELVEIGHVEQAALPPITPFEAGEPRHHTRLFSRRDLDLTVLVGELFVPLGAAGAFADALVEWTGRTGIDDIAALAGVPVPHGPDEHRAYHVATGDYRERRAVDERVPPMGQGFLDGVNGALVQRGIDADPGVCAYVTPVHDQVPDVDAAIRLLDAVTDVHDVDLDTGPLEAFADDVRQYYAELAAAMAEREERPDDRMFV